MGSHSRLVWVVRLVFYPTAIALIAFAWRERRADADPNGGGAWSPARVGSHLATYSGRTSQGEPITASVSNGRLVAFDTHLRCTVPSAPRLAPMRLRWGAIVPARGSDGAPTFRDGQTVWLMTWRPALGAGSTIVNRGLIAPANDHPVPGSGATSSIIAKVVRGTLSGDLLTSIAVSHTGTGASPGDYLSCSVSGVRFTLSP
jgi:hypothetical protein